MRTAADVEHFLQDSSIRFQGFGDGLFVVMDNTEGLQGLAIKVEAPVVIFRLKALEIPKDKPARDTLFESLLKLNSNGLVHCAFGLQEDGVYLNAALSLENCDRNEVQAVIEDMSLAVSQHVPRLLNKRTN